MIGPALAVALAAAPDAPTRVEAERLYTLAEQEERDLDFSKALSDYQASVRMEPSNRFALRSTARARWLSQRSEGDFAPLIELERLRRDPGSQGNAEAIDKLARDVETFPPGEVRTEARMFVAEGYASKLARPNDAARELDALLDEPKSDVPMRAQAASRLVDLAVAQGDVTLARRAAERVQKTSPELVMRVAHWARRRTMFRGSIALVSIFVLLGITSAARKLRGTRVTTLRKFAPKAAAICVYLAIVAAVMASFYERSHTVPFLALPAALFPIMLVARAWGLSGASSNLARAGRAIFSIAAIASVAFIVLYGIDARYLESFGL